MSEQSSWPGAPEPSAAEPVAHPLDEQVRAGLAVEAPWRRTAVAQPLIPIGAVLVLVLVVGLAGLPTGDTAGGVYTLLAGLAAGVGTYLVARPVARAYGGWRQAFGFDLPNRSDVRLVRRWLILQVLSRIGLLVLLTAISPSLSDSHGGNVEDLPSLPPLALVLAGVAAVVIAPVAEELAFRGVLLRALMRRLSFWPAALLSSALFSVLHAAGVSEPAAIPLLVVVIMLFGVLQCVLVRRTGRLGPAIGVHSLMNLFVLVLALAAG